MNPKHEPPLEDEHPFENHKIGNWEILDEVKKRSLCKLCHKSRKYFCYTCYVPVMELEGKLPKITLPVKIDIIKHSREIDGKSTAAHAAVLAPDYVKVSTYPFIPDYGPNERVVLIYPGKEAGSVESLFTAPHDDNYEEIKVDNIHSNFPVTRAVFIDSTWNQSKGIYKDSRLRALPCVVLQSRISQFWRHQKGSPRWYLATVEAVHQFLVELHEAAWKRQCTLQATRLLGSFHLATDNSVSNSKESEDNLVELWPYNGQYDNLLFFFRYMYSKIHSLYDHKDLLSYQRRLK